MVGELNLPLWERKVNGSGLLFRSEGGILAENSCTNNQPLQSICILGFLLSTVDCLPFGEGGRWQTTLFFLNKQLPMVSKNTSRMAAGLVLPLFLFLGCEIHSPGVKEARFVSKEPFQDFQDYWYAGEAELNSYELHQSRYGEERVGDAVLVFVTEDFSKSKQVKLDRPEHAGADRVSVLKMNALRKFTTGVYDYSMMLSVFTPVSLENRPASLKAVASSQEWCGQTFTQFNRREKKMRVRQFSYFEQEGDREFVMGSALWEDELFNYLRMNPAFVPQGEVDLIPGLFYIRLAHEKIMPRKARIQLERGEASSTLRVDYMHLERILTIEFENEFPHRILGWREENGRGLTYARLKKTLKSDYWRRNGNQFAWMRDTLKLRF